MMEYKKVALSGLSLLLTQSPANRLPIVCQLSSNRLPTIFQSPANCLVIACQLSRNRPPFDRQQSEILLKNPEQINEKNLKQMENSVISALMLENQNFVIIFVSTQLL